MSEGGYRGDLEAAQARIAQLEEQLREAQPSPSPALAAAEQRYNAAVETSNKRGGWRMWVGAVAIWVSVLPIAVIAATHQDFAMAGIFSAFAFVFSLGMMRFTRYSMRQAGKIAVEHAGKQLAEARRLQRLEDQVRDLSTDRAHVRVDALASPQQRVGVREEEPVDEDELVDPARIGARKLE